MNKLAKMAENTHLHSVAAVEFKVMINGHSVHTQGNDASFYLSNYYDIFSSSDFIVVLQTVRDLANNARNCDML